MLVRFYATGRAGGSENGFITDANPDGSVNIQVLRKQGLTVAPDPGPQTNSTGAIGPLRSEMSVSRFFEGGEGKPGNTTRFYEAI